MAQLPTDTVAAGEINTREVIMGANKDEGLLTTWPFILGIKKTEMCRNVAYPVFRPLALRLCAR